MYELSEVWEYCKAGLTGLIVTGIFGFKISSSVTGTFRSFSSFERSKEAKISCCGDLLNGRIELLKLPDRNGAVHPDQLTPYAVIRRSLRSSYHF